MPLPIRSSRASATGNASRMPKAVHHARTVPQHGLPRSPQLHCPARTRSPARAGARRSGVQMTSLCLRAFAEAPAFLMEQPGTSAHPLLGKPRHWSQRSTCRWSGVSAMRCGRGYARLTPDPRPDRRTAWLVTQRPSAAAAPAARHPAQTPVLQRCRDAVRQSRARSTTPGRCRCHCCAESVRPAVAPALGPNPGPSSATDNSTCVPWLRSVTSTRPPRWPCAIIALSTRFWMAIASRPALPCTVPASSARQRERDLAPGRTFPRIGKHATRKPCQREDGRVGDAFTIRHVPASTTARPGVHPFQSIARTLQVDGRAACVINAAEQVEFHPQHR